MALSKERFCIWLRKGNCALIGCVADCNKLRKKTEESTTAPICIVFTKRGSSFSEINSVLSEHCVILRQQKCIVGMLENHICICFL